MIILREIIYVWKLKRDAFLIMQTLEQPCFLKHSVVSEIVVGWAILRWGVVILTCPEIGCLSDINLT